MSWMHEGCGGLYEIDHTYGRTVAAVYRFRCDKCRAHRKEAICQMPAHPQPTHPDSTVHTAAMVEWAQ